MIIGPQQVERKIKGLEKCRIENEGVQHTLHKGTHK
jgi:hypothetical protein